MDLSLWNTELTFHISYYFIILEKFRWLLVYYFADLVDYTIFLEDGLHLRKYWMDLLWKRLTWDIFSKRLLGFSLCKCDVKWLAIELFYMPIMSGFGAQSVVNIFTSNIRLEMTCQSCCPSYWNHPMMRGFQRLAILILLTRKFPLIESIIAGPLKLFFQKS